MSTRPGNTPHAPDSASGGDADLRQAPLVAGRYRLKRVIARGGMGMVYLAEHAHLRRQVALKVLTPPPGSDDDHSFQKRFQLEAETLAALDHPNIVTLYDYGQMEDGRYFLAMEFIDGPRFTDTVRDGPLAPDRAIRLLLQVCAALRYAHRRNLVHRDLKPSNLLIRLDDEGNEQVKVVDFGLVKVAEADQTLTKAGHVLGSPHCMSPEQVNGSDVDGRADIYAIGVLLYRSVTGVYPFHGSTAAATMIAHVKEPVPAMAAVAPDLALPPGLEAVIRRCLEKSPEDRYQVVDDLIRDLASCGSVPADQFQSVSISQSGLRDGLTAEPESLAPVPPKPRSIVLFAALGVALAMLLGLVVLAMLRPDTTEAAPSAATAAPTATPGTTTAAATATPSPASTATTAAPTGSDGAGSDGAGSDGVGSMGTTAAPAAGTSTTTGATQPTSSGASTATRKPSGRTDTSGKPPGKTGDTRKPEGTTKPEGTPAGYEGLPEDLQ